MTTRVVEVKEQELSQFEPFYSSFSSNSLLQERIKSKKGTFPTREGPAEEVFNKRWDRTSELLLDKNGNKWKRRLDSIARLIEGSSICAAISVESNSLLIATNQNFSRDSTAQGFNLVKSVMSFFKDIAQNKYDENSDSYKNKFKEIFKIICAEAMAGLQLLAFVRGELLDDAFIDRVIKASKPKEANFSELRDYLSERAEFGHRPSSQGSAFVVCVALMKDFQKVLKFIRANRNERSEHSDKTKSFINAIKNYDESNIITNDKLPSNITNPTVRSKMHAEMRILASIENQLKDGSKNYNNYIGISKLCCLDCHAMMYAINNAAGYNNNIEIRGAHNVEHTGNWNAPFGIVGNPAQNRQGLRSRASSSSVDLFSQEIAKQFRIAREKAVSFTKADGVKIYGATDVSEYHDMSQSSSGEEAESYYDKYSSYLLSMLETLKLRKQICLNNKELSEEIEIVRFGLKVCELQILKKICDIDFEQIEQVDPEVVQHDIRILIKKIDDNEKELLEKFLTNPAWSSEKISLYFSRIPLENILRGGLSTKRQRVSSPLPKR